MGQHGSGWPLDHYLPKSFKTLFEGFIQMKYMVATSPVPYVKLMFSLSLLFDPLEKKTQLKLTHSQVYGTKLPLTYDVWIYWLYLWTCLFVIWDTILFSAHVLNCICDVFYFDRLKLKRLYQEANRTNIFMNRIEGRIVISELTVLKATIWT